MSANVVNTSFNCQSDDDPEVKFSIKIIRSKEDINNSSLNYQVLIIPEDIYDKSDLFLKLNAEIEINYLSSSLQSCLFISKECLENSEVAKIINELVDLLNINYVNKKDEFLDQLQYETEITPFGEKICNFEHNNSLFEIYVTNFTEESKFKEFQARMEHFALFDIDGANCLDNDEKWRFFIIYQVEKIAKDCNQYHFIGYCSAYEFYHFPDKKRPRISQFVIIPSFRRQGLGQTFLSEIYKYYCNQKQVIDVTVEDPCESFNQMRDFVEAERLIRWRPSILVSVLETDAVDFKKNSPSLCQTIHKELRLPMSRLRRLFDIIKLFALNRVKSADKNKRISQFKEDILKRITNEYKEAATVKVKAKNSCQVYTQTNETVDPVVVKQAADQLIAEYQAVVDKLLKVNID